MTPPHPKAHRSDSPADPSERRRKRAGLSAVLALFTACTLLCAPAAAATKKRPPKPAPRPAQTKPEHIGIEHEQSAYPSEGALKKYKLVVRHKAGEKLFEPDPKLISLSVSVYDRDNPRLVAASSDVEKPKEPAAPGSGKPDKAKVEAAEAAAQPKINSTAIVFIQRGDQVFSPGFGERLRKTIKNIEGMEVVGFEVQESEAKRATPAGQQ